MFFIPFITQKNKKPLRGDPLREPCSWKIRWISGFELCYTRSMRSVGDVVAIYIDNKPSVYARVEAITPDIKPHWLQVRLLFLSFPPQEATWILREEYLEGSSFTMKDIPIQVMPLQKPGTQQPLPKNDRNPGFGEVVSFERFRKKKQDDDPDEGDS
jgi:hypothetical protein